MKKRKKFVYIMTGIVVFILVFVFLATFYLGRFLSPQDNLGRADVIVVISGGETIERTSEGVKLFKEGYAPFMLLSGAARSGSVSNAKTMYKYVLKQGVPEDKVFVEENATSTFENASFSKEILEKNNLKKIILVTSPYHQRRAFMTFSHVLGKDYKVLNHSSSGEDWKAGEWWKDNKSLQTTLTEFSRIVYLIITGNYKAEAH